MIEYGTAHSFDLLYLPFRSRETGYRYSIFAEAGGSGVEKSGQVDVELHVSRSWNVGLHARFRLRLDDEVLRAWECLCEKGGDRMSGTLVFRLCCCLSGIS